MNSSHTPRLPLREHPPSSRAARTGVLRTAPNPSEVFIAAEEVNPVAFFAFLALVGVTLWATGHLIID
jgi:hypothetical protein